MDRISRSRLAGDPLDEFVAPRIGHIGMLEFTKADELIERGYRAMQHEIPLIKSVMDVLSQMPSATSAEDCLLYTSPSPRDGLLSRMPSSA